MLGRLKEGESFPLWQGVLHLTRVNNTGAAFGLWRHAPVLLVAVTAVSVAAISLYLVREPRAGAGSSQGFYAWSLILGGALGNLYDRLRFGYVVDFIDLRVWPVFNLADACICLGVALIFWNVWHASHPS